MRLYWKIFLSFWLTMILMVVAGGMLNHFLEGKYKHSNPHPMKTIHTVFDQLQAQPIASFSQWWQSKRSNYDIQLFVSNMNNEQIAGDNQNPRVKRILKQITSIEPQRILKRDAIYLGKKIYSPSGEIKVLAKLPSPRKHWHKTLFDNIWLRISIALLISALICYLLARYISSPLNQLRRTTARIANGDYSARTGIKVVGRNDEIKELARDFDHMAERLQFSIASQQRLVKDISHELRSPIARLQVALELARQRLQIHDSPELERIQTETDLLNQLISQILSLPQLEAESIDFEDVIDLVALIKTIQTDANFEAQQHNKSVTIDCDQDEALISTHGDLLRSAVENVVRNAIRHTREHTCVSVQLRQLRDNYILKIQDYGPGIPDDEIGRIFEAFYRVSAARDRDSGGAGLGLSIAKRAIELHGGKISAQNWQHGLTIEIILPIHI
jgi:two-component system sensor histidine kinase CpxA